MIGDTLRAVQPWLGYLRVSRVGDRTETLISPELQENSIRSYADARGLEVQLLRPELDVSGGKVERPILGEAIARVEQGLAAGIIVDTLDRLSRMDIVDGLEVIRRIEGAGGQVIAVAENFDAATPEGNLVRNMFLSIGQMQRDRYGGKIAASKRRAVEHGIWPTPTVPIGYRMKKRSGAKNGPLEPDPKTAPIVVRAFEMRAGGAAWSAIAPVLGRGASGTQRVVTNRVYLGELRLMVAGEQLVNREAHPAIVTRRLWEAAQLGHPRPARRAGGGPPALLAGLVRCTGCRGLMSFSRMKAWTGYRCVSGRHRASGPCPAPAIIAASIVEPYVEAVALGAIEQLRRRVFESVEESRELEVELVEAEDEFATFQQAVAAADLGVDRMAEGLRSRARRVDVARAKLARMSSRMGLAFPDQNVGELWSGFDVGRRGQVLRGALGVVWVRKGKGPAVDRVKVIAAGFEPDGLPRPGSQRFVVAPLEWSEDLYAGELRIPGEDPGEG